MKRTVLGLTAMAVAASWLFDDRKPAAADAVAEKPPIQEAVKARPAFKRLTDEDHANVRDRVFALGHTIALALVCKSRTPKWYDDVTSEAEIQLISPLIGDDPTGRRAAAFSQAAEEVFSEGARWARDDIADRGYVQACGGLRGDKDLARANHLARDAAKQVDWTGFGDGDKAH